nr:polymer-forming cytoskeletal protein [Desulfobulbaceae bacterium]
MSFFKKNPSEQSQENSSENIAISSIIGNGMNVVGDVNFTGKLRLDGQVKGNIKGEYLILGETGVVTGDIESETCSLQGTVNGNINSRNMNVIKGCRIEGNVSTVNLTVEKGASINGEVKVDEKDLRLVKNVLPSNNEKITTKPLSKASSQ